MPVLDLACLVRPSTLIAHWWQLLPNGTMRERLAALTRKCRHAAHRLAGLHISMYLPPSGIPHEI